MTTLLKGQPAAATIYDALQHRIAQLKRPPHIAIIQVGDNPASSTYIATKQRQAKRLNIQITHHHLSDQTTTNHILALISQLNNNPAIHGILVQLPLLANVNSEQVLQAINPDKDIDGLSPVNLGQLMIGNPILAPATAVGVVALLKQYQIPIAKQAVTIIGRSRLVGLPLAHLLLQEQATVTIAHRQTTPLANATCTADIVIAAAGQPNLVTPDMIKPGAVVIDVGTTKTDHGLVGDVHPDVATIASAISPVPGGIGPLTVACLMANVVSAAEIQNVSD